MNKEGFNDQFVLPMKEKMIILFFWKVYLKGMKHADVTGQANID